MVDIQTYLTDIVMALVDESASVIIIVQESDRKVLYNVIVDEEHIGQLIGEKGCVANSIRILIKAVAKKQGGKYVYLTVATPNSFEF